MNVYSFNNLYRSFIDKDRRLTMVSSPEYADALVVEISKINLKKYPNIKYVICPCTNTDHINNPNNIPVISLEGETGYLGTITSTAEHTMQLMLNLLKPCTDQIWRNVRPPTPGSKLSGKSLGIIGYGRVGRQVAKLATAFSMKIKHVDILDRCYKSKLNTILKTSDIISLHVSVKRHQLPIISKYEFGLMKQGCYIINTSRGEALDQVALKDNLTKLGGVALDVVIDDDFRSAGLTTSTKCILTPHIGGYTIEDLQNTFKFCVNKFFKEMK